MSNNIAVTFPNFSTSLFALRFGVFSSVSFIIVSSLSLSFTGFSALPLFVSVGFCTVGVLSGVKIFKKFIVECVLTQKKNYEVVANIVLEGLNASFKLYSATIAELKATLVRNPSSITLTSLEDTFFSIDNNASLKSGGRRLSSRDRARRGDEQANFSMQSKSKQKGKKKSNVAKGTNKSGGNVQPKKDLKDVICFFCKKPGHYFSKCPDRLAALKNGNKVSFESAHIASECEEHAAAAVEHSVSSRTRSKSLKFLAPNVQSGDVLSLFEPMPPTPANISPTTRTCPVVAIKQEDVVEWPGFDTEVIVPQIIAPQVSVPDFVPDVVTSAIAMMAANATPLNQAPISKALGDFVMWLLDSGATSHFTPYFNDLSNPVELHPPIYIRVADGSRLKATHQGSVEINFTSDQGIATSLNLLRVLFVPGLQTRLFSIESFVSSGDFTAQYSRGKVCLRFSDDITFTIQLPHVPPATYICRQPSEIPLNSEHGFETQIGHGFVITNDGVQRVMNDYNGDSFAAMAFEEGNNFHSDKIDDDIQCYGGENAPAWVTTNWDDLRMNNKKRRMSVELGHAIFGHRAVSSLLSASQSGVWDDVTMVSTGDSWCDSCKVAVAPRTHLSKESMRINVEPLKYLFVDCVPSPGVIRGIPECAASDFLLLCCPQSKYLEKLNMNDKSSAETIRVLDAWRGRMLKKGYPLFLYLRADAGTNFTSQEFKDWCADNNISLSLAGPKHQEQNAFVERAHGTASRMARSMLVRAHLPISFFLLAYDYACKQMRVLPAKGLVDVDGNPTTTYAILHQKKPRIGRFKVFGCPCVFKKYTPHSDGAKTTDFKQLQRGCRGIFVGFPVDQAGWLIYVADKISGSHLVVSMDVSFDQYFVSGINATKTEFDGSQVIRHVGKTGGNKGVISEATGDATNLGPYSVSHWGSTETFDSEHQPTSFIDPNCVHDTDGDHDESSVDFSDSESDSSVSVPPAKEIDGPIDLNLGTTKLDGLRRSVRHLRNKIKESVRYLSEEHLELAEMENHRSFEMLCQVGELEDVDIAPYLPEPKNFRQVLQCPPNIRDDWFKAIKKEIKFIIENDTFRRGERPKPGDEIIPAIIVFKAKITSKGFLDKLKARLVARGDFQSPSAPEDTWAPCVFGRTFKIFVTRAVRANRAIKQLDFIGAFCQGHMQSRLFLRMPQEYRSIFPEYDEFFAHPVLLGKSIYGIDVAHKVFSDDLHDWLVQNDDMRFLNSEVDPSLYVFRDEAKGEYLFLICYVDDCLYFGSDDNVEARLGVTLKKRFNLELQGHAHWFLGTRLYREHDGSYFVDQETYAKHILNRYCGKDSPWGLPAMKDTPAPLDYVYSKANRPTTEDERKEIEKRFPGLSMASAVSSLLYIALNTRSDILWVVNKLAKSSSNPGLKDFKTLMHCFGYLRKYSDMGIRYYADERVSPVYELCQKNNVEYTELVGFSDSSWQDCPDTGKSTGGYKIFCQGGLIEANSTMPVPVALSSAEAEYLSCCNLGAMLYHLRELLYEFEYLGSSKYNLDGLYGASPSIMLIDNQATVAMSKNYRVTAKNRHIGRRWHFVRRGVQAKLFKLQWIPAEDQLADDMTKTQSSSTSLIHMNRTLVKIPDKVRGYKSSTIGNR